MINYIWNKIKNIFKPKRQEPVVLQKEVKSKLDPSPLKLFLIIVVDIVIVI